MDNTAGEEKIKDVHLAEELSSRYLSYAMSTIVSRSLPDVRDGLIDYNYNARKKAQSDEIDRILDKLKKSGYESLTTEEKKSLFDASKR